MGKDNLINYIENVLQNEANELSVKTRKSIHRARVKASERGSINSGIIINETLAIINVEMEKSLNKMLQNVKDVFFEWNRKITKNEISKIDKLLTSRYLQVADHLYSEHFSKTNGGKATNATIEMSVNMIKSNLTNLISNSLHQFKLNQKLRKDPSNVNQQKIANWFAFIAVLISFIILVISISK